MNLIFFLLVGTIFAIVLGEMGKYPFGAVGNAVNILDVLTTLTGVVFLIWKIGIKKNIDFPKVYFLLIGFCFVGLVSLFVNNNFSGGFYLVRFFFYSLFFWIGFSLSKENTALAQILQKLILVCGLVVAVSGFLQLIFFPDLTF